MFKFLLGCFHFFSFFFAHHQSLHNHYKYQPQPTIAVSVTPVLSPTLSPVPSISDSPTPTLSPTLTVSITPEPTETPTPTMTLTPTPTLSGTPEPTETPIPTSTPTPTPIVTPTVTSTPTMTLTPTPTVSGTPAPTETPIPTTTPTPTMTITPTPTVDPAASPTPTMTLTPTPTATDSPTPTVDPASPTPTVDPANTPTPTPTPNSIGNDISYPQCNQTLPSGQGFGIVGVNGGIARTTNPCLSTQLLWANQSSGGTNQSKVQLYVNTGNPGGLGVLTWPTNNTDPAGNNAPNPYGACDGSNSTACAWQYGWNRAVDDVVSRFVPAAQSAGVDSTPSDYPWWLDVETVNSWDSSNLQNNAADLEAMVSYFQSKGITVGIYSTSSMWSTIVGSIPSNSNLNGLHSWLPGASDQSGAQSNCSLSALTSGGSVTLTQFTTNNFDYDYSCL